MKSIFIKRISIFLLLCVFLVNCGKAPQALSATSIDIDTSNISPTALPISHLVISEVMMGKDGNNNYDFIELYNPSEEIIDLQGTTLWYQLKIASEPKIVLSWENTTLIPPHGHYFIGREGEDFGITPDESMNTSLVSGKGSLILTQGTETIIDQLAWGSADKDLAEQENALAPEQGQSIERLPAQEIGNYTDTNNNIADFIIQSSPHPQNTISAPTPFYNAELSIKINTSTQVEPGQELVYDFVITNITNSNLSEIVLHVQLPKLFLTDDVAVEEVRLETLAAGESETITFKNITPWINDIVVLENIYLTNPNNPYPVFAEKVITSIEGGKVPIATARDLEGAYLTVEGVVTMYPDGFFAGSGAKFYIEDETGGIQVYVRNAQNDLAIDIGMQVRVQGTIFPYNEAIEIVPVDKNGIEVLSSADSSKLPVPTKIEIFEASQARSDFAGQLIQVEGLITRTEEFNFSYEVDLIDEFGNILTAYIDKGTGLDIEFLASGKYYRVTGIHELNGTAVYVYPRLFSDFEEIFPEELLIEALPPESIQKGGTAEMVLRIWNHTQNTIEDITVRLPINETFEIANPKDGEITGNFIEWNIVSLAGNGTSLEIPFTIQDTPSENFIDIRGYEVEAPGMLRGTNNPIYIFKEKFTPIWAIQGENDRSPYVTSQLLTKGIITGVFPDLGGFFIQSIAPDENVQTSEGIFVSFEKPQRTIDLIIGDYVLVNGVVSEGFQETHIKIDSISQVEILDTNLDLPTPIALDPPKNDEASLAYYESIEGMLVMVDQPAVAISSINQYGEVFMVLEKHGVNRVMHIEDSGHLICVDDASSFRYEFIDEMENPITQESILNQIIGPLSYNYSVFKIEPILPMKIDYAEPILPTLLPASEQEFRVMTWNVENLFDIKDPTVSSPPTPSFGEYKQAIEKVANTIVSAGTPDIIAIQEVENIDILEDIAEHDLLRGSDYVPLLIEGTDSRLIDVGFLVREQNLTIVDLIQYTPPNELMSRPTLGLTIEINGKQISILNNHFLSMSAGEKATEPRRVAQAAWNVSVMEEISSTTPEMHFMVVGDLNSYYEAKPIDLLRESGLIHVMQDFTLEERYTYIYLGKSQVLDHILLDEYLWETVTSVDILHTNADFTIPYEDDNTAYRKSDHDPVTVTLEK